MREPSTESISANAMGVELADARRFLEASDRHSSGENAEPNRAANNPFGQQLLHGHFFAAPGRRA
jgi:hypothetical protein